MHNVKRFDWKCNLLRTELFKMTHVVPRDMRNDSKFDYTIFLYICKSSNLKSKKFHIGIIF